VRALDYILAVSCVSLFANQDSRLRRQFYGQVGEYRTPAHGLEYRVLSNAWLCHPVIQHMVYDLARAVMGMVVNGAQLKNFWAATEEDVQSAVMNCDVELARKIQTENKDTFLRILALGNSYYRVEDAKAKAWQVWNGGLEEIVRDPKDFVENWKLDDNPGYTWGDHARTFAQAYNRGKV
jgi:hypothetical protein